MEKKKVNKLVLKKEIISILTNEEQKHIVGGWTTSFGNCTAGLFCCETDSGLTISIPKSCATLCNGDDGCFGY